MKMFKDLLTGVQTCPAGLTDFSPHTPERSITLFAAGGSGPKRTIRAGRRRQSASEGPVSSDRPEAPHRREESGAGSGMGSSGGGGGGSGDQGGFPFPTGGGGGTGSGGGGFPFPTGSSGLPGLGKGMSCTTLVILGAVLLCVVIVFTFMGGSSLLGGGSESPGQVFEPEVGATRPSVALATEAANPTPTRAPLNLATRTPRPANATAAAVSGEGRSWLVMMYQDADDKILEQDIYVDLNEAERIGSSDNVKIVTQIDRYRAGFSGDGDWSSTKRFFVTRDNDLNRIGSQEVADLGEVNMADGQTLVDFVAWAVENYPADRYALILSDHGMGWPGGWSDPTAGSGGASRAPIGQVLGDQLYLNELDQALEQIRARTGIEKLDLVGMDACLMGHVEVLSALEPHARVAVVSQETEPSLGWAYTSFLSALTENPGMNPAELGDQIVQSYIVDDQRIVDDRARSDFLRQSSPFGSFGNVSAAQLASQLERDITLTAVNLETFAPVLDSLNELAFALQNADQRSVAQARTYARSFTSIFGSNVPASYIDLVNFAQLAARESGDTAVNSAVQGLMQAVNGSIIAEKHGSNKRGATGLSVYFPTSNLYRIPAAGPQSYTAIADRFANVSLWDDFLVYHYTGRGFERAAGTIAVPQRPEDLRSPAAGQIRISPIQLSDTVAAPGQPVLMSADISGQNIGHILLFVGILDPAANSIYVADLDYLESGDTRELDGVYYPDWGVGDFTLELEWEPTLFAINDGQERHLALFTPRTYGATADEAIYTVEGNYAYASGETRSARMFFQDGILRQVFGFQGQADTGAPREINPQAGDSITLLERWMDLDQQGRVVGNATQEGETLTFGGQGLTWEEVFAPAGSYVIGFIVQDLDGNEYAVYAEITVQ